MSFAALMEDLRREYVLELPAKIQSIAAHLAARQHQTICEDFHKLKGTGKTYGIPEISELAEVVERICLDRPQAVVQAIPPALDLLREIHQHRAGAQAFDITDDQRFSSLKKLAG